MIEGVKFDFATELIVLGNGFDLHCGLKSTYKDFLEYILKNEYKKKYPNNEIEEGTAIEFFEKNVEDFQNAMSSDTLYRNHKINVSVIDSI